MSLILIVLCGLFDRMRGSGWFKYSHFLGMLGMGIVIALILHTHGWIAAYVVCAVVLGAAPGWGNPLGAAFDGRAMGTNYEWWQVGSLRKYTWLALFARGVMWGVLLTPISQLAVLAFAVPFTITPYIIKNWAWMEVSRGTMIGALLVITNYL